MSIQTVSSMGLTPISYGLDFIKSFAWDKYKIYYYGWCLIFNSIYLIYIL